VAADRGQVFEEHRGYLFGIAYRMLGSVGDAEDAVQEAFVRWTAAGEEDVRFTRSYLATIVVRLCMDQLRSAKARREVYVGPWLPEPLATAGQPDPADNLMLRESLSVAFLYMLETLAPLERAVFILREVFDYDYAEIAAVVGKGEANCRQVFHRARQHLAERKARFEASDEQRERVTEQFLEAASSGQVDQLLGLLAEDVVFVGDGGGKVPGAGTRPVRSRESVAKGFVGNLLKFPPDDVWVQEINGQRAIVSTRGGHLYAVLFLELAGTEITGLYAVLNPDKLKPLARQLGRG
jgi:RNA polymerase sigma-70 factor (ECF subfamily)